MKDLWPYAWSPVDRRSRAAGLLAMTLIQWNPSSHTMSTTTFLFSWLWKLRRIWVGFWHSTRAWTMADKWRRLLHCKCSTLSLFGFCWNLTKKSNSFWIFFVNFAMPGMFLNFLRVTSSSWPSWILQFNLSMISSKSWAMFDRSGLSFWLIPKSKQTSAVAWAYCIHKQVNHNNHPHFPRSKLSASVEPLRGERSIWGSARAACAKNACGKLHYPTVGGAVCIILYRGPFVNNTGPSVKFMYTAPPSGVTSSGSCRNSDCRNFNFVYFFIWSLTLKGEKLRIGIKTGWNFRKLPKSR